MTHFLVLGLNLASCNVRSQAFVVVYGAHDAIDDRHEDENDGKDSEGCKFLACCKVILLSLGGVHANELEDEVCEAAKVEDL